MMDEKEKMKQKKNIYLCVCFSVILLGFSITETAFAKTVRIGGTGFGLGIMKIFAGQFEKSHPGAKIEVIPSLGSSGGIKALLNGVLDIAVSGRPLVGPELGKGIDTKELAKSPFIFIANKNVAKAGVTEQELKNIFSGETLAWPDGSRIRLVLRPERDIVTKMVKRISLGMNQAVTLAMSREGLIHAITDQESVEIVESIPGALASSTLIQVYSEKRQVKILAFNGAIPSAKTFDDGSYPLSLSLYLVVPHKVQGTAQKFIEFIYTEEGRNILMKNGGMPAMGLENR
jgi:phosphate transport system substrate-binding protein